MRKVSSFAVILFAAILQESEEKQQMWKQNLIISVPRIIGTFPGFISNYLGLHILWCKAAYIFLELILGWGIENASHFAVQNISICF